MKSKNILSLILIIILFVFLYIFIVQPLKPVEEKEVLPALIISEETVYVENAKSNTISVIDVSTNKVIRNITVGKAPHDLKLSPDQGLLYSTDIDSGTISIIDTTTRSSTNINPALLFSLFSAKPIESSLVLD
ncbi:MAG: hypothetical protein IIB56_17780 [Planctomycetes bacterium]|nr:hypothetical protein [Planctomycetota bacterium]